MLVILISEACNPRSAVSPEPRLFRNCLRGFSRGDLKRLQDLGVSATIGIALCVFMCWPLELAGEPVAC